MNYGGKNTSMNIFANVSDKVHVGCWIWDSLIELLIFNNPLGHGFVGDFESDLQTLVLLLNVSFKQVEYDYIVFFIICFNFLLAFHSQA